ALPRCPASRSSPSRTRSRCATAPCNCPPGATTISSAPRARKAAAGRGRSTSDRPLIGPRNRGTILDQRLTGLTKPLKLRDSKNVPRVGHPLDFPPPPGPHPAKGGPLMTEFTDELTARLTRYCSIDSQSDA